MRKRRRRSPDRHAGGVAAARQTFELLGFELLGRWLDPHSVASIRKALDDVVVRPHTPSLVALRLRDGRELQGKVHAQKGVVCVAVGYVKRLTGRDRVMVYRFDEQWHGEVTEEQCSRADVPLYFGLRFPASDISSQARALNRTGLIRYIADVTYTTMR